MNNTQRGFSLIELMIGLVIGLIATLVITNVFSKFEQQKRVTTGGADAQTNGSIALYTMRREIENAGYGLPVFNQDITPLRCPINVTYDHDVNGATPEIGATSCCSSITIASIASAMGAGSGSSQMSCSSTRARGRSPAMR